MAKLPVEVFFRVVDLSTKLEAKWIGSKTCIREVLS
jgi:hypothetical protein